MGMTEQQAAPAEVAPSTTTPAMTLDLNPTAFLDDLYNAVEVHCAEGFEELDSALRNGFHHQLTPEQLTVLLTGTAGLYQDLRAELKNRMQTFEQYALAEILKIPPGLLADPVGTDATTDGELITEEEEAAVDEELLALQKEVAATKRRGRDAQAAIVEMDKLMESLRKKMETLETVPGVLGSKENLLEDMRAIAAKGVAVEAGCMKLDALRASGPNKNATDDADGVGAEEEPLSDAAVEREILKRQGVVKNAPVEDIKAFRETLGL